MSASHPALTDQEIDFLADFLYNKAPENTLSISELHGLLSAIAAGPEPVDPSQWLPQVWGVEAPEFTDLQEAEQALTLILRLASNIRQQLHDDPDQYWPIYMTNDAGNGPDIDDWCYGFMIGVSLGHETWDPRLDEEDLSMLVMPITLCALEYSGELPEGETVPAELRAELVEGIPIIVPAIYQFWNATDAAAKH